MIRLLPLDDATLAGLVRDPDGGLQGIVSNGPEIKAFLQPMLEQGLEFHRRIGSQPPWHGYLAVEREANRLVGICAFKGNPNADGEVEIAYGTVPGLENRGYATAMAWALLEIGFRSDAVRRISAHTLPQPNASTRVLQKIGMRCVGEVHDPEDGTIWRWEMARPSQA